MSAQPVALYPLASSIILEGGTAAVAAYGPTLGGRVTNPASASEPLFVDCVDVAGLTQSATTFVLAAGESFDFPPNSTTNVSVNAATSGHEFSGYIIQPPTQEPPTPQTGTFPPPGPVTLSEIIPAYLYQQYDDDDDLQAFVSAYNGAAQTYVDWSVETPLPVYTDAAISGTLLDWIAQGIYGEGRPSLSSGVSRTIGPLNTYWPNYFLPLNTRKLIGPSNIVATTDDVFKRILTWNHYRGDGNRFDIKWLKRRVMRFLIGANGTAPNIPDTYPVSVSIAAGVISIQIGVGTRKITGGALPNRFGPNQFVPLNSLKTEYTSSPESFPLAPIFEEAVNTGVLVLPAQYSYHVAIGG